MKTPNDPLAAQFAMHWQEHFQWVNGTVLLACSGGLDSMALAGLLLAQRIPFALAHCNFGLRGAEADADEHLVRDWAVRNGIPFYATRFDTEVIAAADKKGIQETARRLRYEWFEQLRAAHDCAAIATAHHAGDVAETVLFNLFRGTGLAGLHGIAPRNGHLIRPLLFASKSQLRQFAEIAGIPWREDASNEQNDYSRNAIRNEIIPVIQQHFPDAVLRLVETAARLAESELIYGQALQKQLQRLTEQRGADLYVPLRKLLPAKPLATLIYEIFRSYGFSPAQVPEITKLMEAGSGAQLQSDSHRIIRDREFLIVTAKATAGTDLVLIEAAPARIETADAVFFVQELPADLEKAQQADSKTAYLDAGKLEWPLRLRRKRTGDYFYPLGMGGKKKKVGRFLIAQKVPLHEKERIWVLENGCRLAWVGGHRIDERFRLTAATKTMLEVKMLPKAGGEIA